MDTLTQNDVQQLVQKNGTVCVSLFFPMHRNGRQLQEDTIRLKNLLSEAKDQLASREVRRTLIREMLEPAKKLVSDQTFWSNPGNGAAIFIGPDQIRTYRLPIEFEEQFYVDDHFHIRPLLPLLVNDGRFYLLAVSQKEVRFFEGTRQEMRELPTNFLPENLADAIHMVKTGRVQFHQGGPRGPQEGGGLKGGIWHGHLDNDKKRQLTEYFHRINAGLEEFFGEARHPLVFAGVEYLFPIFREACHYKNLVDECLPGSPELESPSELHDRAWRVVEPWFRQREEKSLRAFHNLKNSGGASDQLADVILALQEQRVQALFVRQDAQLWGTIDEQTGSVKLADGPRPEAEDLIETAVFKAVEQGGEVYLLEPERMPGGEPLAALYRYSFQPLPQEG